MAGSTWNSLAANTLARASEVNENLAWLEGHHLPFQGGSTTTGVFNLGTATAKWFDFHMSGRMQVGATNSISKVNVIDSTITTLENLLYNTNSVTSASHANFRALVGGPSGGDPFYRAQIAGGEQVSWGVDNSANDVFKIVRGANLDTIAAINIFTDSSVGLASGSSVNQISTDGTFSDNSDNILPTQQATKEYVDNRVGAEARAFMGSSQTPATTTGFTVINFNTLTTDPDSNFTTASFRYEAPVSGRYWVTVDLQLSTVAVDSPIMSVFVNGTEQLRKNLAPINTVVSTDHQIADMLNLALNDTVDVRILVDSSVTVIQGGTVGSSFAIGKA